jgi:NADH:ubiquinone oxidoreductase subunit C
MNLTVKNLLKILPIIRFELYNTENCLYIQTNLFYEILIILKTHFKYQFKILTCISGVDYPNHLYRFQIVYELLSVKYNSRLRLKILVDELGAVNSIESIFPAATWWENEIWDMFGVYFFNQYNLTRLLTDYGFQGYPLRKDFPLSGFTESRYNVIKHRVVYENLEFAQEYRTFEYLSPWENYLKS